MKEVITVTAAILLSIWIAPVSSALSFAMGIFALVWILISWLINDNAETLGLVLYKEHWSAWKTTLVFIIGGMTLISALALIIHPNICKTLQLGKHIYDSAKGYILSAAFQQILFLGFFVNRLNAHFKGRMVPTILWSAGIFALIHIPNPVLVPATFMLGAMTSFVFLKYEQGGRRTVFFAVAIHAVLAAACKHLVANPLLENAMRIGPGFFD